VSHREATSYTASKEPQASVGMSAAERRKAGLSNKSTAKHLQSAISLLMSYVVKNSTSKIVKKNIYIYI
jgi:hypothetical protein